MQESPGARRCHVMGVSRLEERGLVSRLAESSRLPLGCLKSTCISHPDSPVHSPIPCLPPHRRVSPDATHFSRFPLWLSLW